MTDLYLIRHGEAEGNLYRRMHGVTDSALTDLGLAQAAAMAARFSGIRLQAVYSSDLCRAMATAEPLCRSNSLPLHIDPRLREVNVGPWEDSPFGSTRNAYPDEMHLFTFTPHLWSLPGADSFSAMSERGIAALHDIVRSHPDTSVAVCSHSMEICSILCGLFLGPERYREISRSANTSVTHLRWEDGHFSLLSLCDASHLTPELRRTRWQPEVGSSDLIIEPFGNQVDLYIRYRREAWEAVYGSVRGFNGGSFWLDAQRTVGPDPEAMVTGRIGTDLVGMIQLSPDRDARKGVGYIPLLYLRSPFRSKGLAVQLIGHAVSFYRKLGRRRLQLSVAPTNAHALHFYRKLGFVQVGKTRGRHGQLLLLEKDIAPPSPPAGLRLISH